MQSGSSIHTIIVNMTALLEWQHWVPLLGVVTVVNPSVEPTHGRGPMPRITLRNADFFPCAKQDVGVRSKRIKVNP